MPEVTATLKFAGETKPFAGTFFAPHVGSPGVRRRPLHFWGVDGEGEITGGRTGREIRIVLVMHDDHTTFNSLRRQIEKLDAMIGRHGELTTKVTGDETIRRKHAHCTLLGYEPTTLGTQERPGPLKDEAGTLDGGWFQTVELRFYQLQV